MQTHIDDADGFPIGVYDIAYYELKGDRLVLIPDCTTACPRDYVETMKIDRNEAARAICRSQRGGRWIFGSAKVAKAHR